MSATETQIQELAETIATHATAIAEARVQGPLYAAVRRLEDNVDTLKQWVGDDR